MSEPVKAYARNQLNRLERPTVADEEAVAGLRQAQAAMRDTAVRCYMQCLAAGARRGAGGGGWPG